MSRPSSYEKVVIGVKDPSVIPSSYANSSVSFSSGPLLNSHSVGQNNTHAVLATVGRPAAAPLHTSSYTVNYAVPESMKSMDERASLIDRTHNQDTVTHDQQHGVQTTEHNVESSLVADLLRENARLSDEVSSLRAILTVNVNAVAINAYSYI